MGIDRERLTRIMTDAAKGDDLAAIRLYQHFGLPIGRAIRGHLGALNALPVDTDDLNGLTMDVCIDLADRAAAWRPDGGALPWVWAERSVRAIAARFVGQWADPIDEDAHALVSPPIAGDQDDPDELELLQALATELEAAGLLAEALNSVTSTRNQRILLAYRLQASMGDRSPANTTAAQFGMTPPAVRQVVKRTTDKLRAVIATNPRYGCLDGLALVA